jgi:hypothetical protein
MKDRDKTKDREVTGYVLRSKGIQHKTDIEIKSIKIKIIFRRKSKNSPVMKEKDHKKDKIKISKMIMKGIKIEKIILETIEETMIVNFKKHDPYQLIEALRKNSLARMFMMKTDFIEITAQYLNKDVLKENLSQDCPKEEVLKNLSPDTVIEEVFKI